MKYLIYILIISLSIYSCNSSKEINTASENDGMQIDTIRIANDSLEYEVLILEPGFDFWLNSRAKPRDFYDLGFLENKNRFWIQEYNRRARNLSGYGNLYPQPINYEFNVDYGFEVNYLLYNYLLYFQEQYNQKL